MPPRKYPAGKIISIDKSNPSVHTYIGREAIAGGTNEPTTEAHAKDNPQISLVSCGRRDRSW